MAAKNIFLFAIQNKYEIKVPTVNFTVCTKVVENESYTKKVEKSESF